MDLQIAYRPKKQGRLGPNERAEARAQHEDEAHNEDLQASADQPAPSAQTQPHPQPQAQPAQSSFLPASGNASGGRGSTATTSSNLSVPNDAALDLSRLSLLTTRPPYGPIKVPNFTGGFFQVTQFSKYLRFCKYVDELNEGMIIDRPTLTDLWFHVTYNLALKWKVTAAAEARGTVDEWVLKANKQAYPDDPAAIEELRQYWEGKRAKAPSLDLSFDLDRAMQDEEDREEERYMAMRKRVMITPRMISPLEQKMLRAISQLLGEPLHCRASRYQKVKAFES